MPTLVISASLLSAFAFLLPIAASSEITNKGGFFERDTNPEEFIHQIPSDCDHIAESNVLGAPAFFLFQLCHRGGGAWLHEIPVVKKVAPGIIYIPSQSLSREEVNPGYYCSRFARRLSASRFLTCTKQGWAASPD